MASIDYFVSYYGPSSWRDIVLSWGGDSTSFSLYADGSPTALYTGAGTTFTYQSTPNTRTDFVLVGADGAEMTLITFTTVLPTPVKLTASLVTDTGALLSWGTVSGVDSYEIADVSDSYGLVDATALSQLSVEGLTASSRYSLAIRCNHGTDYSAWSQPVTFFTKRQTGAQTGAFTFKAASVYVWAAGMAGSTDPQWLPLASNWYSGNGANWGDVNGTLTTYFFYGPTNPFTLLSESTVTKAEVYLDRDSPVGDPGLVLSRWGLHRYLSKPSAEPSGATASADAGTFARGQYGWVELPVAWGQTIVSDPMVNGLCWGGVPERFQAALNTSYDVNPRTGDLRITCG